jgi:hypothetical protein
MKFVVFLVDRHDASPSKANFHRGFSSGIMYQVRTFYSRTSNARLRASASRNVR